jgi:hypothetical protein
MYKYQVLDVYCNVQNTLAHIIEATIRGRPYDAIRVSRVCIKCVSWQLVTIYKRFDLIIINVITEKKSITYTYTDYD